MAVFKRAGSPNWLIEFTFKGHKVRQSSGTTRKREAEERERILRQELKSRLLLGKVAAMSLGEAVDRYYDTVVLPKGNVGVAKRELYALNQIREMLRPATPIENLTAGVISDYKDHLLASKKAPATVNRYLAMIKAILNRANSEWGTLAVVPRIKLLPLSNARHRWLTEEEEMRLLPNCSPHLRNLVVFLIDSGARLREATTLGWGDVDLDRKPRAVVRFMRTKSGRPRAVPLSTRVEALLRELKNERPDGEERVFLYHAPGSSQPVPFDNPFGTWDTARRRADLEDVNLHDLRHTFASRLVMRGVPLPTVSQLLGHASIHMTMRYAHLSNSALDAAIDSLER
ncbi:MAG: site-specific integrase [Alphaproteobacteria bacterium]|nr:site-specific integrase [Alphaproteobacteria bacterium]